MVDSGVVVVVVLVVVDEPGVGFPVDVLLVLGLTNKFILFF